MAKDSSKKDKSEKKRRASEVMEVDASVAEVNVPNEPAVEDDTEAKKKKVKKNKEVEIDVPLDALSPIARPLADKKLAKKMLRTIKKASKSRQVKRGVKEVVKSIRKGEKGLVVMAGDITPMDVLTHIPLLAEESMNPYIFVTSKELLGHASNTKRPTSCVMVCPNMIKKGKPVEDAEDYSEAYKEVAEEVKELNDRVAGAVTANVL